MNKESFEWDPKKNELNIEKHEVSFYEAQKAFQDPYRIIAEDIKHSTTEQRYYCFGKVDNLIMTVRFTYKDPLIRLIGAGYWREGKKIYEKAQKKRYT